MLYKKDKVLIRVDHGFGNILIGPLRGLIENIVVEPKSSKDIAGYVIYDLQIFDSDQDMIFWKKNLIGPWCYNSLVPVGKSADEHVSIVIDNSSFNIDFKIILLTKER